MKEILIVPHVGFSDIVLKDFFFIRVLFEVFFEGSIADELLLEFENFLLLDSFVGQVVDY